MRSIAFSYLQAATLAASVWCSADVFAAADYESNLEKNFQVTTGGKLVIRVDQGTCELLPGTSDQVQVRVLRQVKDKAGDSIYTKSGLMLGLGETEEELFTALADLRQAGCQLLTLGQYLQPTLHHLPVVEFVHPDRFTAYGRRAREMGFLHVASAPMVRSSYHADEFSLAGS